MAEINEKSDVIETKLHKQTCVPSWRRGDADDERRLARGGEEPAGLEGGVSSEEGREPAEPIAGTR